MGEGCTNLNLDYVRAQRTQGVRVPQMIIAPGAEMSDEIALKSQAAATSGFSQYQEARQQV